MKKTLVVLFAVLLAAAVAACGAKKKPNEIPLKKVDLSSISDGVYTGEYVQGNTTYQVETTVRAHRITEIEVLQNKKTEYAKKAEAVTEKVILKQNTAVDGVTGATKTSRALQKAIENSLLKPLSRTP
jgi:uncharacterized protein with FMN-binding domain